MASYKNDTTGSVGKVVLMGSSTGANDIMWYLTRGNETELASRYPLDAVILQGPVSDQDYINWYAKDQDLVASLQEGQGLANSLIAAGTCHLICFLVPDTQGVSWQILRTSQCQRSMKGPSTALH